MWTDDEYELLIKLERDIPMPTPSLLDDVEHWIARSSHMRALADLCGDEENEIKLKLLKIAGEYMALAEHAMGRLDQRRKDRKG